MISGRRGAAAPFPVAVAVIWAAIWSLRILSSGSYYTVWRLLWYGDVLPGPLGLILFPVAAVLGSRLSWRGFFLLAGSVSAIVLGDYVALLQLPVALALGALLWLTPSALRAGPGALASALALDSALRIAVGGVDPLEHPVGRLAYAVLLSLALLAPGARGPGLQSGALLSLAGVGLWYPGFLVRMGGGVVVLTPWEAGAHASVAALAAYGGGLLASRLGLGGGLLATLAGPLAFQASQQEPLLGLLGAASLGAPLAAVSGRGGVLTALSSSLLAEATVFSHAAVFVGPYIGIPWMMEVPWVPVALASGVAGAAVVAGALLGGKFHGRGGFLGVAASLAILALASPAPLAPEGPATFDLGVATYNVHQGFTPEGRLNGYEVAATIADLPGVVCLQEVDAGRATSAFMDLTLLLTTMGYDVAYQPAISGVYGVAVASPGTVERLAGGTLEPLISEVRAYIKARVDLAALDIIVLNVHLGLSPSERKAQAKELASEALLSQHRPHVICGDLNEGPGGPAFFVLESLGYRALEAAASATCCLGEDFKGAIDWILASEDAYFAFEARVVYSRASDHLPVAALLSR